MSINYLKPGTLTNKRVLLRVDVNVPIDEQSGTVADIYRIQQILPTIHMLLEGGNGVIVCGHLGRPERRDTKFSLRPVAKQLAELMVYSFVEATDHLPDFKAGQLVFFAGDITRESARKQLQAVPRGALVVLENMRFYEGEEKSDPEFVKMLSSLGDIYVNDAFAVDHHPAASVSGVSSVIPSYAGPLLQTEILSLERVIKAPVKPFVLMMGGIKISDKVGVIENLGEKVDKILLGGGIANLFFAAKDIQIGQSKIEKDALHFAWQLSKNYKDKILLPQDVVVADASMDKDTIRVVSPYEVKPSETMLDIGPKTILAYAQELKAAKTIVWNGPMGHFEVRPFHTGTMALARVIGGLGKRRAYSVVGGGETVDALRLCHQSEHIDHVSTGGGAMLEYLAGKKLPGVEALK